MIDPYHAAGTVHGFALVLPWALHHAGGVNQVVRVLYSQLSQSQYSAVVVVASWENGRPVRGLDPHGRRTVWMRIRTPFESSKAGFRMLASYGLRLASELGRAVRLMRDYNLNVVSFHYVGAIAFTWALMRRLRLYRGVLLLSFHGTDLLYFLRARGIERALGAWMLRSADGVIVCSNDMARRLSAAFDVEPQKLHVIHNGVDPVPIRAAVEHQPALSRGASDDKLIVSLGTFDRVKGHDILLQAFAKLRREHADARLTIVGRSGAALDATRAAVAAAGLDSCVELVTDATHDEAMRFLNRARLFVLPSRNEGLPFAVLEAGVLGKPVIASAVGGIPDVVRDREDGILVPTEDPLALYTALAELLGNPELSAKLAGSLRQRVLDRFTQSHMMEGYIRAAQAKGV